MSFFCRLTNGFTYAGAISFTVWPSLAISRPPVVGARTRLQGHRAGRQCGQEREELAAAQLLAKDHRARAVSPMQLKDVLGEIQSDGAHLVHGRLLEWPATPSLWHTTAAGGVHTITAARRTIQGFEAMLWLRKGFGFAGAWTVCEQNQLLAVCFG